MPKIPTRHLELTRRKLEFTRLPHEASSPKSAGLWEPKAEVEQLIDFWMEKYSWRDQESVLNTSFPQFRTSIALPSLGVDTPLRIHFIHVRSPHTNAVPLLLLPPFPFTNLSFGHLIPSLTDPPPGDSPSQPFHVMIPSLPGLGFSDALPSHIAPIPASAALLEILMARLSYTRYIATTTVPGHLSPSSIDWRLIRRLSTHHTTSCAGAHFISPPLTTPDIRSAPWEWTKWNVARFFRAGVLGYSDDDFSALERAAPPRWLPSGSGTAASESEKAAPGLNALGPLREPNALAYALCDSPAGMLVFLLRALWLLGKGDVDAASAGLLFSQERIITLTQLAWLPGFENVLRFWAHAANHERDEKNNEGGRLSRPKVAVTVFLSTGGGESRADNAYACPAWANAEFDVLHVQRLSGKNGAKGLLAFERPEVIVEGIRALAKRLLAQDTDVFLKKESGVAVVPLERVVVIPDGTATGLLSPGTGKNAAGPGVLATPAVTPADEREEHNPAKDVKGKGKEGDIALPPPAPIPVRDPLLDGESPDTLVEEIKTPPLGGK